MRPQISVSIRRDVIIRANSRCEYCLVHEDNFYLSGEVDHIKPIKHGGENEVGNLAYSCVHCNRNKGYDEAIVHNGKPVRIYNPRFDFWTDHFELSEVIILPKTEIAEVTLLILKMNAEERIRERLVFESEGTYPPPNIAQSK